MDMKCLNKSLLLSAFLMVLASCQVQDVVSSDAVQVCACINSLQTRVSGDGMSFTEGDAIKVSNTSRTTNNTAVYTYSSTDGSWTAGSLLLWEGSDDNEFHAWYPVTASYESFNIPMNQSSGLDACDWMTADVIAKRADGGIDLAFSHHLSKVTIEIKEWRSEYAGADKVLSSLKLKSLSGKMTNDGETVVGDGRSQYVETSVLTADKSYAAIVAPGTYAAGTEIMTLALTSGTLTVKTAEALTLEPSNSYKFSIIVGKDLVTWDDNGVSVGDWKDGADLGEADLIDGVLELDPSAPTVINSNFEGGDVSVPLNANIDYSVSVDYGEGETDWISVMEDANTRASMQKNLKVYVKGNIGVSDRSAVISIYNETLKKNISINVSQDGFNGYDDGSFDENKYLIYALNFYSESSGGVFDTDISNYCSIITNGCYDATVWEFKFKLAAAPGAYAYYPLFAEYVGRDNTDKMTFNSAGFGYNGGTAYTWSELGVNPTDLMVMKFDMEAGLMWVNGKQLNFRYAMKIEYLFSSYYYDSDDGRYYDYRGFQDDARLYYVKGWMPDGRLIYLGGASMQPTGTGNLEACWYAKYYDTDSKTFVIRKSFSSKEGTDRDPYGSGNMN